MADIGTAGLLKNLDINEISKVQVKEYFRHLKSNRRKGPDRMKKEKSRHRRIARVRDVSRHISHE